MENYLKRAFYGRIVRYLHLKNISKSRESSFIESVREKSLTLRRFVFSNRIKGMRAYYY